LLEKFGPLNSQGTLGAIIGGGETMVFGDEFYLGINGILGFDWRIAGSVYKWIGCLLLFLLMIVISAPSILLLQPDGYFKGEH
jgi:hypothetical protein